VWSLQSTDLPITKVLKMGATFHGALGLPLRSLNIAAGAAARSVV